MYISNTTPQFEGLLAKNKLSNVFDQQHMYFRDTSASYNKVYSFIQKKIQVTNAQGTTILETDKDIVPTADLNSGTYTVHIQYTLQIPPYYNTFIDSLQKKYGVQLTDRELAILALKPGNYDEPGLGKVKKLRETRATVYVPQNIQILNVTGQIYYSTPFYPPFANGVFYQA